MTRPATQSPTLLSSRLTLSTRTNLLSHGHSRNSSAPPSTSCAQTAAESTSLLPLTSTFSLRVQLADSLSTISQRSTVWPSNSIAPWWSPFVPSHTPVACPDSFGVRPSSTLPG